MADLGVFRTIFKLCQVILLYAAFAQGTTTRAPNHGRWNPGAAAAAAAAAQPTQGFLAKVGSFLWWLGFYGILSLATFYLVYLLFVNLGIPFLRYLLDLRRHPRVEETKIFLQDRRQRLGERRTEIYYDLVYNYYTDQAAFRWQQLRNFVRNHARKALIIGLVVYVALRSAPKYLDPAPEALPYHLWDRYGYYIPCWMQIAGEANEKGTSRSVGPGSRCDPYGQVAPQIPPQHVADEPQSFVDWDDHHTAPAEWYDTAATGQKKGKQNIETTTVFEPTTITVYEETETETETVYEPTTITVNDKGEKRSVSTKTKTLYGSVWSTIYQTITTYEGAEEPSTVTISEDVAEPVTITQDPETVTVPQETPEASTITIAQQELVTITVSADPEAIPEPSTITIEQQEPVTITISADPEAIPEPITVTVPQEAPEPSTITSWTILANVTPTTVNRWTISTVTSTETLNLTTTIHHTEPKLAEDGTPMTHHGDEFLHHEEEHDHVRRDVENEVWCEHCKQYHCCQLPY